MGFRGLGFSMISSCNDERGEIFRLLHYKKLGTDLVEIQLERHHF